MEYLGSNRKCCLRSATSESLLVSCICALSNDLLLLVVPIKPIGTKAPMRRSVSGTDVKSTTSFGIRVISTIGGTHKRLLIFCSFLFFGVIIILVIILAARNIDKKRCREH